jgi:hypothetical protein
MFTTHYEGTSGTSWIEFGSLDGNYAPNYSWAQMPGGSERWQLAKLSTNFGDMQSNGVIIDAGSSYTHAGDTDMKKFLDFIGTKKSGCTYLNYIISCPCSGIDSVAKLDNEFPEFEIELGSPNMASKFNLKGSSYFTWSGSTCQSTIRGLDALNDKDYWLLGTNFYRAYEIIHDQGNNRMGFKAIATSTVKEGSTGGANSVGLSMAFMVLVAALNLFI